MFFRKGRGSAKTSPALRESSMPTCDCGETSRARLRRILHRVMQSIVIMTVVVVVVMVDPVPWDVVLPVLVTLAFRG